MTSGWDQRYILQAAEAGSVLLFDHLLECMPQNDIPDFDQDFKDQVCKILLVNGTHNQQCNDCLIKWFFRGLVFKSWMAEYAQAHHNENARKMIVALL